MLVYFFGMATPFQLTPEPFNVMTFRKLTFYFQQPYQWSWKLRSDLSADHCSGIFHSLKQQHAADCAATATRLLWLAPEVRHLSNVQQLPGTQLLRTAQHARKAMIASFPHYYACID